MEFNAKEYLEKVVKDIEGKSPLDLFDYFEEALKRLEESNIVKDMHVGKADFKTLTEASEFLLGQFIGIIEKGKENQAYFNAFGSWLKHVYHFVIDNKTNLE